MFIHKVSRYSLGMLKLVYETAKVLPLLINLPTARCNNRSIRIDIPQLFLAPTRHSCKFVGFVSLSNDRCDRTCRKKTRGCEWNRKELVQLCFSNLTRISFFNENVCVKSINQLFFIRIYSFLRIIHIFVFQSIYCFSFKTI